MSNYSSGTVIARGCGNKYQPGSSLTINILWFSKLAQAWSLLKPFLSPHQRTVIGSTLLCCIPQPCRNAANCHPNFMSWPPGIPFCTSRKGQRQYNPGWGSGGREWDTLDIAVTIPHPLNNSIALLLCGGLYTHA